MPRPLATLVVVVYGDIYQRYADDLLPTAEQYFLPGQSEIVVLAGEPGWPHASGVRYKLIVDACERGEIHGQHIFLSDADNLFNGPVGTEILSNGITVTTHPGYPPDETYNPDLAPFERNPISAAFVPMGKGGQYHPGAFVGGQRDAFLDLAHFISAGIAHDELWNAEARWYDEAHLNRYLIDRPPALVLDKRYCWWEFWGVTPEALIVHRDKTPEEMEARGQ